MAKQKPKSKAPAPAPRAPMQLPTGTATIGSTTESVPVSARTLEAVERILRQRGFKQYQN